MGPIETVRERERKENTVNGRRKNSIQFSRFSRATETQIRN